VTSDDATLAIIVQARMGSTRLPGKVLAQVQGRTLLSILLERLARVSLRHRTVVATTDEPEDDAIVAECRRQETEVFRGATHDVLARYLGAAAATGASEIVRITADCPLTDPQIVDRVIAAFRTPGIDYASNTLERTFPRGLDVEVFSRDALEAANRDAVQDWEREHVTPFIYHHPERFTLRNVANDRPEGDERWTVDTPEDLELVTRILGALLPSDQAFGLPEIRGVLSANPAWREINANVRQNVPGGPK
jgi:spore coat polysaccharide biosynthesis protein SpsF